MKLPNGVTVHAGNKKFVGEIPDLYAEKYGLKEIKPAKKVEPKKEEKPK